MVILYYGQEKIHLLLLQNVILCVFSITASLDRRSWQMDAERWYISADYRKLCNTFSLNIVA